MSNIQNKITISYTRPNTSVDWGPNIKSTELSEYYQNNYIATGMLVAESVNISDDGLTLTRSNIWNDSTPQVTGLEIMLQYKSDTIIQSWLTERNAYNQANGIVPSVPYNVLLEHEDNLMLNGSVAGPYERV
jgi:hypothetical protein